MNLQFSLLQDLTAQYDAGKIDPNTVFNLTESSITAYILMHRMFVDNCKSFQRNHENTNISALIIDLQKKYGKEYESFSRLCYAYQYSNVRSKNAYGYK